MRCPYCEHYNTKVMDSREVSNGWIIRRRRKCEQCQKRFSTQEKIEILNLTVIKRSGQREEFIKNKLSNSLSVATNKRIKDADFQELIDSVKAEIYAKGCQEITTKEIGNIILKKLKKIDEVSYLRYISVFKSFGSGKRFTKELEKI